MAGESFYVEESRRARDAIIRLGGMAMSLIVAVGVGALFKEELKIHQLAERRISVAAGLIGFCVYYVLRILEYRGVMLHCSRKLESIGFLSATELSCLGMSERDITRFTQLIVVIPVVLIVVIGISLIFEWANVPK